MALTETKMKVVSDIAEDTYPAVAFQIKDNRREIEMVRDEILGDKRGNTSLDEVMHGVLSKKTLAAAAVIGGMVLSACGVSVEIVTPNATATETQPGVTETAPGVSETPTLEVTPTATEVTPIMEASPTPENIEYAEINKRIEDFLNAEGNFTEEELEKLPHMGFEDNVLMKGNYFGVMKTVVLKDNKPYINLRDWSGSELTSVNYQVIYLGAVLGDNNRALFFMGMKDRENNRMIVPIGRTVFPEDGDTVVNHFTFLNFDGGARNINNVGSNSIDSYLSDFGDLSRMSGEVAVFGCYATPPKGNMRSIFEAAYGSRSTDRMSEIDNSIPLCRSLYNSVTDLRNMNGEPLNETSDAFVLYDSENFKGVEDIQKKSNAYIFYDSITFVRP